MNYSRTMLETGNRYFWYVAFTIKYLYHLRFVFLFHLILRFLFCISYTYKNILVFPISLMDFCYEELIYVHKKFFFSATNLVKY